MPTAAAKPVLEVSDLSIVFRTQDATIHAVNNISFTLAPGELLGVVGESGAGKSVAMMSLAGLLPSPPSEIVAGRIMLDGEDVRAMTPKQLRGLRGSKIGYAFQDPMTSLNPVFTIGFQLMEPLLKRLARAQARERAVELLAWVGIPDGDQRLSDYPHQFSGGMRQRVMVAMALAAEPKILIADEPTTALDVTIQAQLLELIRELRHRLQMAIVWITHDLGVVAGIADRIAVMYGGQIVECAEVGELFANPRHPYTRALLQTLPQIDAPTGQRLTSISGQPPNLTRAPADCAFAPRCPHVFDKCRTHLPPLDEIGGKHQVACWWQPSENPPAPVSDG